MSVEYVLFGIEEMRDLKKSFLSSQLSTLNSLQSLQNYKKLRNEENNLKIKLKSILEQTQNEIQVLKKILPETKYKSHKHAGQSHFLDSLEENSSSITEEKPASEKRTSIEQEIEDIRKKLQMLQ